MTAWVPSPPVSSRTRSTPSSPRSATTSVAPNSTAQIGTVGVAAHQDDLLCAESLCGQHRAQSDRAVSDDGDRVARAHPAMSPRRGGRCRTRRTASAATASVPSPRRPAASPACPGPAARGPPRPDRRPRQERPIRHRDGTTSADPLGRSRRCCPTRRTARRPGRPRRTRRPQQPTSSTMPMNSWPMRRPCSLAGIDWYGHRSLPQMHAE